MNHMTSTTGLGPEQRSSWDIYTLFALCALAFSVSLGAALVGLSKLLVLIAFVLQLWRDGWPVFRNWWRHAPATVWVIGLALAWLALTGLWTEADLMEALTVFIGHGRLFWLLAALYLIRTPDRAWSVLMSLAAGQGVVLVLSWLFALGMPVFVPYAKHDNGPNFGVVFTSTLEQPIMNTLLCILLWHLRNPWIRTLGPRWGRWVVWLGLGLAVSNVFLVMTGRTGYLVMLLFMTMSLFMVLPQRWRVPTLVLPVVLVGVLFQTSSRFHDRVMRVGEDIALYQKGERNTSMGLRLDNWRVSIEGIREKPIFGHGVGSFSKVYKNHQGHEQRLVRDPHQQYLFWFVEGGVVAFLLLLSFFVTLVRDAGALPLGARRALICTTALAATMAMANCPFFGVGMGEFFLVMMAGLLSMRTHAD